MAECPDALKPYRWKPGQSGNPKGPVARPRFEAVVAQILDEQIPGTDTTKRETVARVFVDMLMKRNGQMIREYLARDWPAVQKHEVDLPGTDEAALDAALARIAPPSKTNGSARGNGADDTPGTEQGGL